MNSRNHLKRGGIQKRNTPTNDSSPMSNTTSKGSRNCFHSIKWLFLIIMSLLVNVSNAVKVPGFGFLEGIGARHRNENPGKHQKPPRSMDGLMSKRRSVNVPSQLEIKLISDLLQKYGNLGKYGRPIRHPDDKLDVYFGLTLLQILAASESDQHLRLSVWYKYKWTDCRIRWKPSEYGNVKIIHLPSKLIWTPDIHLFNVADDRLNPAGTAMVAISWNGTISWSRQAILKSSCTFDTKYFPFDVQSCHMKFGSWAYPMSKLDVHLLIAQDNTSFDLYYYTKSNEWDVLGHNATRNVKKHQCCIEPFSDITFHLAIRRRVAFYTFIVIIPCVLLSFLTHVIFWVPAESPAKLQLGMSVFIAFFFLLLVLSEFVPRATPTIPIIGIFFCLSMIMITVSTVLATLVSNMYYRGVRTSRAPKWMRSFIGGRLAKLVCLKETPTPLLTIVKLYSGNEAGNTGGFSLNLDESDNHADPKLQEHNNGTATDSDFSNLLQEVRRIRCSLSRSEIIINKRDEMENVLREWHILSAIADRLFFIFYCTINILVTAFVFTST